MSKIIGIHVFNDYSGSPLVFRQALEGFVAQKRKVELYTSRASSKGFLSGIPGVVDKFFPYKRYNNKGLTMLSFFIGQFVLFLKVLGNVRGRDIIYVNTILPFGAALAGRLLGKRVIYHMHETSISPRMFKAFLLWMVRITASDAIYVSDFLRKQEPLTGIESHTVYNALPESFVKKADTHHSVNNHKYNILMLCSLKLYKGVHEFVSLANSMNSFSFDLVLNASINEIKAFFNEKDLPENLSIHPAQEDVHRFYRQADVVLNLSHTDKWIETFGMTILEAMNYGIPVIVPPKGGVTELVKEGYNGFQIESNDLELISRRIIELFTTPTLYNSMAIHAKKKSKEFSVHQMQFRLEQILDAGYIS